GRAARKQSQGSGGRTRWRSIPSGTKCMPSCHRRIGRRSMWRRDSVTMWLTLPELQAFRTLTADGRLLMLTRVGGRLACGGLSVVFALYLAALGLTAQQIGLVLTLTLVGDSILSLG